MDKSRPSIVFHFALTSLMSVAAFMFLPGYRLWSLCSLINLVIACALMATWAQRKVLCGTFAAAAALSWVASRLTLPSGDVSEEGVLLFVLVLISALCVTYAVYRSQLEAAA